MSRRRPSPARHFITLEAYAVTAIIAAGVAALLTSIALGPLFRDDEPSLVEHLEGRTFVCTHVDTEPPTTTGCSAELVGGVFTAKCDADTMMVERIDLSCTEQVTLHLQLAGDRVLPWWRWPLVEYAKPSKEDVP